MTHSPAIAESLTAVESRALVLNTVLLMLALVKVSVKLLGEWCNEEQWGDHQDAEGSVREGKYPNTITP